MEHRNTELELDFPSIQVITIVTHTHRTFALSCCVLTHITRNAYHLRSRRLFAASKLTTLGTCRNIHTL